VPALRSSPTFCFFLKMANCGSTKAFTWSIICIAVLLLALAPTAESVKKKTSNARRQSADHEMRLKRMDCERTVCAGLQREAKTSCSYKCISEACYNEVYAHDELEEGEVDTDRARQFGFCFRKVYRAEADERADRVRKEAADRRAELQAKKDAANQQKPKVEPLVQ